MTMRPCPRCTEAFDDARAAGSRAVQERDVDICAACGEDEAFRALAGEPLPLFAQWPVARKYDRPPAL